jgi:phage shock protein PspC (stress-responsive transcriptional regulator)
MGQGRKLQRNLRRRRLGGVCAGIADFLGIGVTWVRLAVFASFFLSFGITFWLYVALWIFLPARPVVPMPAVSSRYADSLRRADRLARRAHRRLDAAVADQAEDALDALKLLAARVDAAMATSGEAESRWHAAADRFERMLAQLLALPAGLARESGANAPRQRLVAELGELAGELRRESLATIEREINAVAGDAATDTPEVRAWKTRMAPMWQQLRGRLGAEALASLRRIEEKLVFLLERGADANALVDLKSLQIRGIAHEYLPDAINEYLRLAPEMARTRRLPDGRTAEDAFTEQLGLLDNALADLAKSYFDSDAQGLLVHGRFLREKFADHPFRLPS